MPHPDPAEAPAKRRADVERNERALLEAAASVFVTSGVDAPVREVAAAAGVGIGTLYRHFPTRSDLIVAVYRHQIEECANAGPALLAATSSPIAAMLSWVHLFVDFLGTKHGLANVMRSEEAGFSALHGLFLDRLVPVLSGLIDASREAGEVVADVGAYELIRAIGDLCAWDFDDPHYDARKMVMLMVTGLRVEQPLPESLPSRARSRHMSR